MHADLGCDKLNFPSRGSETKRIQNVFVLHNTFLLNLKKKEFILFINNIKFGLKQTLNTQTQLDTIHTILKFLQLLVNVTLTSEPAEHILIIYPKPFQEPKAFPE